MKFHHLAALVPCLFAAAGAVPNQDGLIGADKTHSAQTLGKGRLQFSGYSHVIDDDRLLQDSSRIFAYIFACTLAPHGLQGSDMPPIGAA